MTTLDGRTEPRRRPRAWATRLTGATGQFGALLRHAPLTVAVTALIWIVGAATGSLRAGPSPPVLRVVGTGPGALAAGQWWTPVSSALWCADITWYLVTTVLLLTLVAPAEHRFGAAKTGLLLLITQIGGTFAGSALVQLGSLAGDEWTEQLAAGVAVGAGPAAVGVGLAMTSRLSTLWRRRLRLLLLLALLLLVAYSGTLPDVLRLAAGLTGLLAGPLLLGRSPRAAPLVASRSERRVLVALVVAATSVGPVVAALSDTPIGPLSVLRYLLLAPPPDAFTVQQICADPATVEDCRALRAQLTVSGVGPAIITLLPVVLLLVTATGLRRGRRAAWWAALLLNLALAGMAVLLATELFGAPRERLTVFGGLGSTRPCWRSCCRSPCRYSSPRPDWRLAVPSTYAHPAPPTGRWPPSAWAPCCCSARCTSSAGTCSATSSTSRPPWASCCCISPPGSSHPATWVRSTPRSCPSVPRRPCCPNGPGWCS